MDRFRGIYFFLFTATGYYLYVEASSPRSKDEFADLISPPLTSTALSNEVKVKDIQINYSQ